MTPVQAWTCPSCRIGVGTPFCAQCGEKAPAVRDLTLRGMLAELMLAIGSLDGRLLRSFRLLLNRPGALTVAHINRQRTPYIGPFQLFLIANVLFFAAQSMTGANILSSTLDSHLNQQDWSATARALVAQRVEALQTTPGRYAPVFDKAVVLNAKALIILMALPFTLLLPLVFARSRQPFGAHAAFALHLYAMLLLLFCVSLSVAAVHVLAGGAGLLSPMLDNVLSVFNLAVCTGYLYAAIGPVYGERGVARAAKAGLLALAVAAIVLGYRFVIFLITLYTA